MLTCENYFVDGYLTEKLNDILFCCRVPIYFGYPNIDIIFPELFKGAINGFRFNSVDEIVHLINIKRIFNFRIV